MATLILNLLLLMTSQGHATVTLLDKGDWKLNLSGFVEIDNAADTEPSFLETAGNYPISGPDTPAGQGSRDQISGRNSRLAFTLLPPGQDSWKPKAYVEFDFLGNRESLSLLGAKNVDYTDPSLRIRHLYVSAEHEGWRYLSGQTWTLFGWVPTYVLSTVSVAPGPGSLYQRTQQFTVIRDWGADQQSHLQVGLSFAHASQGAGGTPNIDFGARYSNASRRSGFSAASDDIKTEPLSVAVSGTIRHFGTGALNETSPEMSKVNAYAAAFNTLIPLLASQDGRQTANTLTLTAELTTGTGYGDAFPGWSGNLPSFPFSAATQNTFLGKGQGGFDSNGQFHLFQLLSWNAQLQYHLPGPYRCFATLGHSELSARNVAGLGPVAAGLVAYDEVAMSFANVFHDFSSQFRGAIEYAQFTTRYVDGTRATDGRYQLSGYYRF